MYPQEYSTNFDPYDKRQRTIIRIVLLLLLLVVILVVGLWLRSYLSKGSIIINTNQSAATITLSQAPSSSTTSQRLASYKLIAGHSRRLPAGTYTAEVQKTGQATAAQVTIKARQSTAYTLNLTNAPIATPVADVDTNAFAVGATSIIYAYHGSGALAEITSNNTLQSLNTPVMFSTIAWASSSYGIGQSTGGGLFLIANGIVSPIANTPATISSFAVAPNKQIYVASRNTIYVGSATTNFTKLYTAPSANFSMAPSTNGLSILLRDTHLVLGDSVRIMSIGASGNVTSSTQAHANSAVWSPQGTYLATASNTDTEIYSATLQPVTLIPTNSVTNIFWLTNHVLLYVTGSQLWEYSLTTGQAHIVANTLNNQAISYLTVGPGKTTAYFSAQYNAGATTNAIIEKASLNGTSPTETSALNAQEYLPYLASTCLLSLVNFTAPVIQSYGGAPFDNCQQLAQAYLQQVGLNSSAFGFTIASLPPYEPSS